MVARSQTLTRDGSQPRDIKALSEPQLADLKAGHGWASRSPRSSTAIQVPGPYESSPAGCSSTPTRHTGSIYLYEAMKSEAIAVGAKLIAPQRDLDGQFATASHNARHPRLLTLQVGERHKELRAVHLKYPLTTAGVLTPGATRR